MSNVIRIGHRAAARRVVAFNRRELSQMLSIYSDRVMRGEWRDYAIDHGPGVAAFSIYRDSTNRPIYTIVKYPPGSQREGDYMVKSGPSTLRRGPTLADVLTVFRPALRLLNS